MAGPRPNAGFTLVELLVTLVLGGMLMGLASSVITSHLRTTQKQSELQRMRDHWGRINFFLETEIREGQSLGTEQGEGICADKSRVLTITVPNPAAPGSPGRILYYNNGVDLWRCGPSVNRDGTLDFANQTDGILVENASLSLPSGFTGPTDTTTYTVTLRSWDGGSLFTFEESSSARTSIRSF
jgi:prepilin-type N-terminal cleavage/methylation domain-containing protein